MHHFPHSHTQPGTTGVLIHWATLYDRVFGRFIRASDQRIVELAGVRAGDIALDVGCGPGSLTRAVKRAAGPAGEVYGIDAAPEMIERARRNAEHAHSDVDFQIGVIERLPFPDATFDLVVSRLVFHHLPGDLKRQGLAEILRVLKPGGACLVVDFDASKRVLLRGAMHMLGVGGMARTNVQGYVPLFEGVGFRDIGTGPTGAALLAFVRGRKVGTA